MQNAGLLFGDNPNQKTGICGDSASRAFCARGFSGFKRQAVMMAVGSVGPFVIFMIIWIILVSSQPQFG